MGQERRWRRTPPLRRRWRWRGAERGGGEGEGGDLRGGADGGDAFESEKKPRVARTLRHELLILENRTKSVSAAAAASCGGGLAAAADGDGSAAIPNE